MLIDETVFLFALGVMALCATWIFLHWSLGLMLEAWHAMEGREWRQPEGPLVGPGQILVITEEGERHVRR
jgi:hypothetical protein